MVDTKVVVCKSCAHNSHTHDQIPPDDIFTCSKEHLVTMLIFLLVLIIIALILYWLNNCTTSSYAPKHITFRDPLCSYVHRSHPGYITISPSPYLGY